MNTTPTITPAYLVYCQQETTPASLTLFTHQRLLTARKEALSYAERLLTELWQRGDLSTQIEVRLVETNPETLPADTPTLALIYRLDLPTTPMPTYSEAKADLHQSLGQLDAEYHYYLAGGHAMGFGCFQTEIEEGDSREHYTHLFEAAGYFHQLIGIYEWCRRESGLPLLVTYATYLDCYVTAGMAQL